MRIDGTGRIVSSPGKPGTNRGQDTGARFTIDENQPGQRAAPTSAPHSAGGIDALLALQAVDDATTGRRKAIKRANSLLDALEDIRADLLAGRVSEGKLNRAMALLGQAKRHSEPGLDELVADIELRVRVELAKLGKYPSF
ncbi:flagellar assembly protein FliX [Pelagibacterium xiamenense]|uniref:flagellar assembly protein FliX n=1 Tax=Pelagibacterium xiamenense TaxID=2901140 RepID=UPI001E362BF9|nr:flagellar assembly protein FliX [Pelagibacterium xiamenense]MCD7060022.1 flagellar assembly protein FliX [Pelagibacterium xiamenense]